MSRAERSDLCGPVRYLRFIFLELTLVRRTLRDREEDPPQRAAEGRREGEPSDGTSRENRGVCRCRAQSVRISAALCDICGSSFWSSLSFGGLSGIGKKIHRRGLRRAAEKENLRMAPRVKTEAFADVARRAFGSLRPCAISAVHLSGAHSRSADSPGSGRRSTAEGCGGPQRRRTFGWHLA